MNYAKIALKVAAAGGILWAMYWILSDILTWGHVPAIFNVVLAICMVGVFAAADPLSKFLNDRLPLPKDKPAPNPAATKWRSSKRDQPPDLAAAAPPAPAGSSRWPQIRRPLFSRPKVKFHIPHFRAVKRWSAAVCVVVNFVIGELSLTGPGSQPFAVFFLLNSFLLADYLWKTRRPEGGD